MRFFHTKIPACDPYLNVCVWLGKVYRNAQYLYESCLSGCKLSINCPPHVFANVCVHLFSHRRVLKCICSFTSQSKSAYCEGKSAFLPLFWISIFLYNLISIITNGPWILMKSPCILSIDNSLHIHVDLFHINTPWFRYIDIEYWGGWYSINGHPTLDLY